jgi:hypothetical protein
VVPTRQKFSEGKKTSFLAVTAILLIVLAAGVFFWFYYSR